MSSATMSSQRAPDRDSLRRRALPFLLVSLLGLIVAFIPSGGERVWLVLGIAVADLCAVAALALFLSARRHSRLGAASVIGMSLGGIALLLLGDGHPAWDLVPLVLLPVVWCALYRDYGEVTVTIGGAVGVIVLAGALDDANPLLIVRTSALWTGVMVVTTLGMAADELHGAVDVDSVINVAVTAAANLIGSRSDGTRRAHLAYAIGDTIRVLAEYADDGEPTFGTEPMNIADPIAFESLTGSSKAASISISDLPDSRIREVLAMENVHFLAWMPLRLDEEGRTLLMVPSQDRPFTPGQLERLGTLGSIVQLALRNALAREQLEQMAATDTLTGLTNRKEWLKRLATIPRGTRYSVLSVDVDQLREVNASRGHEAGDRVLKSVGAALTKTVRRQDIVARTGGDEFATLLLGSRAIDAARVAERVIKNLQTTADGLVPRISIGVASGEADTDPLPVAAAADAAMSVTKQAGGGAVHATVPEEERSPLPVTSG
ncbi:MAG: GGDEF domain-containing protein [Chloroflexi bacterium]|nr:MAG: GGDEF domain-containing protein [Chloroflexota bacterium]